jgi:hypothetical protein
MIFWAKRPKSRDNWSETYNNCRSLSLSRTCPRTLYGIELTKLYLCFSQLQIDCRAEGAFCVGILKMSIWSVNWMVTIRKPAENVSKLVRDMEKPAKALLVFKYGLINFDNLKPYLFLIFLTYPHVFWMNSKQTI